MKEALDLELGINHNILPRNFDFEDKSFSYKIRTSVCLCYNAKHLVDVMRQVSLDLVKGLYAKFIEWDVEMIDQETGTSSYAAK